MTAHKCRPARLFHQLGEVTHEELNPASGAQEACRKLPKGALAPFRDPGFPTEGLCPRDARQRDGSEARTARPHTVRATETARCRRLPAPGRNSPEMKMRWRRREGRRKPDTRSPAENAPQVREGRSTTGEESKQKKKKPETKRAVFKTSQCRAMGSDGEPESQPQSVGNYKGRSKGVQVNTP